MEFKIWLEQFETAFDFLLNKDYTDKSFNELLLDFEESGGKWIGSGKSGNVFAHPNWKYVLKTFVDDSCYLKFVRFAYKNPHPAFPKFYGLPHRILPQFKRQNAYLYYVRMEKLIPVQDKVLLNYVMWTYDSYHYLNVTQDEIDRNSSLKKAYDDQEDKIDNLRSQNIIFRKEGKPLINIPSRTIQHYDYNQNLANFTNTLNKYPQIKPLLQGYELIVKNNFQCASDMHEKNIMQRENGELVLIDPLWYGSNPYMDADRQRRMEIDDYDDNEPEMIRGGQRFKPKRLKPMQKKVNSLSKTFDDTPF